MNCHKENNSDGDCSMKDQYNGIMIQDHAEQAGGEGDHDQRKHRYPLCTQLPAIHDGMDNAQQQEDHRCHFMNMDTGERNHNGYNEADKKHDVE